MSFNNQFCLYSRNIEFESNFCDVEAESIEK